jgi:hypothetical protein
MGNLIAHARAETIFAAKPCAERWNWLSIRGIIE